MTAIESKLISDSIRFGSDGNGIFIAVKLNNRWVMLTSQADVYKRKIALIRAYGGEAYGLMSAHMGGETEIPHLHKPAPIA